MLALAKRPVRIETAALYDAWRFGYQGSAISDCLTVQAMNARNKIVKADRCSAGQHLLITANSRSTGCRELGSLWSGFIGTMRSMGE